MIKNSRREKMGKKYLETKNNSLESSVLGVWKTAAGEGESIRDAAQMTKAESKLDTGKLPSMKDALMQIRSGKSDGLDEAKVNPKDREELDTAPSDTAKKIKRALEPAPNQMVEASGDKEAYKKFFDAALKKFKASSPADLKGDQKKKFFDYIDANWEGDNEKAEGAMSQVREFKIQSMKAALAKVWGLGEGKNPHDEEVELDEGPMDGFLRLTFKSPADVKKAMKVSDTEFGYRYFSVDKARTRPEVDFEGDREGLQRLKDVLKSAGIKFEIDLEEAAVNPKDREELDTAPSDTAKKIKRALEPAPNQMVEASGDKEAYKKFFDAALKKFKASSPADLKGDQKKKFFDYIDANWEGDNEKAEGAMSQVREYKIQSMKAALAKVWGLGEGLEDSPNPANKQHLCAKNVVHEEWGSGNCVPTQHANPDEEGNIAWYDVMFEHGIEKEVSADNLKIIEESMHSHSSSYDPKKKMKMKKEVTKTATGKKAAVIDVNPKIKD